MAIYQWRGRASNGRYEYDRTSIPAELLDVHGNPLSIAFFNGEHVIQANTDYSVARSVAAGVPPGNPDLYSAYIQTSPWEENTS